MLRVDGFHCPMSMERIIFLFSMLSKPVTRWLWFRIQIRSLLFFYQRFEEISEKNIKFNNLLTYLVFDNICLSMASKWSGFGIRIDSGSNPDPEWGSGNEGDRNCLVKVQKRAVKKMISGLKSNIYEEQGWENSIYRRRVERRHQADMARVHKIIHRGEAD